MENIEDKVDINEEENKISNTDNTSKIKSQLNLKTIEDLNFD